MSDPTTRYVIEAKSAGDDELATEWRDVSGANFDAREDAEQEWSRLNDLYGHDTYHRIVQVKRKVLKSA